MSCMLGREADLKSEGSEEGAEVHGLLATQGIDNVWDHGEALPRLLSGSVAPQQLGCEPMSVSYHDVLCAWVAIMGHACLVPQPCCS